jgi:hypothetical protein
MEVDKGNGGQVTYSPRDDFNKSVNECYRVIKERMANGGPAWNPNACPMEHSNSANSNRGK